MPPANKADNGGGWITTERRKAIYVRDNYRCAYCDFEVPVRERTLDHIKPQTKGGTHHSYNLVLCCRPCNSIKGDKTIRQFFKYLREAGSCTKELYKRIQRRTRRKMKKKFRI